MAERIPLVLQPPKTTTPKVWLNGAWADAPTTDIVTKGTDGKISSSVIPEEVIVANAPTWAQSKSWKAGALAYHIGQVYRANTDIPANTPFVISTGGATWQLVTSAAEISNVPSWTAYNPGIDRAIREGEMYYYSGSLYRSRANNVGNEITSTNHFEKLTGFTLPPSYVYTKSYTAGELIRWQGYYVTPNTNIGGNVPFEWGASGQAVTWRPVLFNGYLQYAWRGVMTANGQGFFYGDVIAPTPRSNILYVCVAASAPPIGTETTPLPAYWAPLINDTPIILDNYLSKADDLTYNVWKFASAYKKNTVVVYTDGNTYIANADIPANTLWAVGTTGATWKALGGGAVTDFVANQAYNALQLVRNNGELYISNAAIPANTVFVEGTTGATWKKVGSGGGSVLSDVPYIQGRLTQAANVSNGTVVALSATQSRDMSITSNGINLKANQTYLISTNVYLVSTLGSATFQWSNNNAVNTTGLIGPAPFSGITVTHTANEAGSLSTTFIYSPTVNETIYLKRTGGAVALHEPFSSYSVMQISGSNGSLPIFQGATNTTPGKPGVVAAPVAGAEKKILFGDGEWKDPAELLSSEIPFVSGTISAVAQTVQTTGSLMPIVSVKNYGITCTNNRVQLKANQTYMITTSIHVSGAEYAAFRWRNITDGLYIDPGELLISDASGTSQATGGQGGNFIYTPTKNLEIALVRSRDKTYPSTSDGYSQWTVVQISGTAGAFPIFQGSTATVQGKAGALAAAPLNTQDYVLYGSGEWKPLTAASSTGVVTKGQNPAPNATMGGPNVFLDRQSRINVDGILSTVRIPNYGSSGAVVVMRPQIGESSFSTGGKFDLVSTTTFASGTTSVSPGSQVKIGDYVGVWVAGSVTGTYVANGPTNNLVWLQIGVLPALPLTLTVGGGNTLGLGGIGFDVTTLNSGAVAAYVSPKMAMGTFSNTGASTGYSAIFSSLIDSIGVSGVGTSTLTLPAGKYIFEWQWAMSNGSIADGYYYSTLGSVSNATLTGGIQTISFWPTSSSWKDGDASVGCALVSNTAAGDIKLKIDVTVGNGANAAPSSNRMWWKITKMS
ncbi:hypothetical protein Aeh1ORF026c [Aeromonas phage Aeh1]|uniref:Uncharacterized protein n=1 Tax=Aeromonas phage Aeh1 TaxID=2880362 RepID=Q76Z63_9CAUD|nr:hypothetical protein Aeh1p028 [Aeromonas phage Aeh1]AAQ17683.1 hypothetical protein Aeh1ORF026c [Aeromonas phage Aeh1]